MHTENGNAAMRTLLLATAVLGLASGAAHAGEGGRMPPRWNVVGNPFPYAAAQARTVAAPPALDTGSQAYPAADGTGMTFAADQEIPPNNNEGPMQTANSLPPGYAPGEVTFLAGTPPASKPHRTVVLAHTGSSRS